MQDLPSRTSLDVAAFIDQRPVGALQRRVILLCAAILFADGFDTQAIGFVAPALSRAWNIPRPELGPVLSAGLVGLMLGALVLSPVADRLGRRRIVLLSTAWFALGTLATVLASDKDTLIALRFATGLGLGGAMPNAVALAAEYSPHRRRATLVMLAFCGFSVGAAVAGAAAALLVPRFGWQSVFVTGGVLPLALLPLLAARLPESIRFLVLRRGSARAADLLRAIDPAAVLPAGADLVLPEPRPPGLPVAHLFGERRAGATLLIWIVYFMSLLDLYFLSNWLPTVMTDLGAADAEAALISAMLQVGGFVAVLLLGRAMDRFSFAALTLTYVGAALAIAAVGRAGHSPLLAAATIFAAGFGVVGAQTGANALVAAFYPTALRSTGVGWALGIGRLGSIVGPLLGGLLLARHWATADLFAAAAVPSLLAALAAAGLWRQRAGAAP